MSWMLELPKSTYFGKIIPKDRIYKNGGANRDLQTIFAKQVGRVKWANKISSDTVNVNKGGKVTEIEVIEIEKNVEDLDRRILPLVSKAIKYHLLYILIYKSDTTYAVHYNNHIYMTNNPPKILGGNMDVVWESIVRQVAGFPENDIDLMEQVTETDRKVKITKNIENLEKKASKEKQPRRKWQLVEELNRLKSELEE